MSRKDELLRKAAIYLADLNAFDLIAEIEDELAKPDFEQASTPSANWRQNGENDPHGSIYNCERASLCMGKLTDDELANAVYLNPGIVELTAAKERIRWLSRKLSDHHPHQQQAMDIEQIKQTRCYQNADFNGINAVIWFKRGFEQAEKSYGIGGKK